jgi:hypothetical protein
MSGYFDSKLLDEYDSIVFGLFFGDLYWEYAKWQSFIRWYIQNHPTKYYEIWTRNNRKNLYSDIKANIMTLNCTIEHLWKYEPEGYKLKGYPEPLKESFIEAIEGLYTDGTLVFNSPYIDRDDFFDPKQMNMNLSFNTHCNQMIKNCCSSSPDKIPIVLAPPREGNSISEKSWQEKYEKIAKVEKYIVFIVGERGIITPVEKYPSFYVLKDWVEGCNDNFGLSLCAILNCIFIEGSIKNPFYRISEHLAHINRVEISM